MAERALQAFLQHIPQAVKGTLSKYRGPDKTLRNIYFRPVELKGGLHMSCTWRYDTRDEVKNYPIGDFADRLSGWMQRDFRQADLFTTDMQYTLKVDKSGEPVLLQHSLDKPAQAGPTKHDREKTTLIDPAAPFLQALGISSASGQVLKERQKKFRQINHYIELVGHLIESEFAEKKASGTPLHISDMGSGKGYLTFALYDYLQRQGFQLSMTGVELRENLVDQSNDLAQALRYKGLIFRAGDIAGYEPRQMDVLIALHACDTATDLALAKGVQAGARLLVVAPCCQKQVRKDLALHEWIQPIARHGILQERLCEWLTDGLRALILESVGYKTQVMEFISLEHTPKNLLLVGIRQAPNPQAAGQVRDIMQRYGLSRHALLDLLPQ